MSRVPARRWTPGDLLLIVAILLSGNIIGTALVLLWAWRSQVPWRELGFVRSSKNWPLRAVVSAVTGVLLKIAMKTVVMPLFGFPAINPAYDYLRGNRSALPGMLLVVVLGGGFGEELIWRGFLFERFRTLLGPGSDRRFAIVLVSAVLFGLAHYVDQGIAGVTQSVISGLVFGAIYATAGELWWSILAHAAFDVTAVLLIYSAK